MFSAVSRRYKLAKVVHNFWILLNRQGSRLFLLSLFSLWYPIVGYVETEFLSLYSDLISVHICCGIHTLNNPAVFD